MNVYVFLFILFTGDNRVRKVENLKKLETLKMVMNITFSLFWVPTS